ncbi:LuxR C-terminal-related transcriptional regulator [Pseudonocardia xinjiangensis]|uniref:LuxR C-terminal-related transcriptional regulator n=1 Tax=Pseudonocardia xinjiangensis TaxID=75289 RepID=UPI003D8C5876
MNAVDPPDTPAKFAVPVASHLVARPRLEEQLTAGLGCPVTLVAATAGWGKTLLAASWLAAGAGDRQAAWVRLDSDDDDPVGFWRTVAAALAPVTGPEAGAALRRLTVDTRDVDEALPAGFAAALRLAPRPVVLVLDNLHEVTSPEVHAGLVRLVERPLPALSMLVLTRRDPPWPLSRLRMAGLLAEVRAQDLAFREAEAAELFALLHVDLDPWQVRRLVERTEGWPAGLRLVALHLHDRADVEAEVAAFSGDDHSVAGYLVTEVLDAQPPELVRFVEKISTVDLVCADLADALTGRRDSEQVLTELAASHLFVQAVDRPGRWYHLHRLIGDLLQARPVPRRERRDLRRRAAEWFARNGMPLDAVRSAIAGALWPLAADLVGRHLVVLVLGGHSRDLERVLDRVPRAVTAAHPELACGLAAARVVRGVRNEVAELIAAGRARIGGLPPRRAARARILHDLTAGALARIEGDWDTAVALYRSVPVDPVTLAGLGLVKAETVPVLVNNFLGMAALLSGDLPEADRELRAAVSATVEPRPISQLNAAAYLTMVRCERGELDTAERAALEVIGTAVDAGLDNFPQAAGAYLTMAHVALDRAEPDEIDDWLGRAEAAQAIAAEPHVRVEVALLLAARRVAARNPERALSGLRATAASVDLPTLPPAVRQRWSLTEATLLANLGNPSLARALLDRLPPARSPSAAPMAARLLVLLDDLPAAVAARSRVEVADHPRGRVDIALLDTVLAAATGDEDAAPDRLEEALTAAEPWSLRRPFLAEVIDLRPLLERRLERGTLVPAFVVDILTRLSGAAGAAPENRAQVDPLTERERTVLRYLASTLSNSEIAAELYVSVNTVKTHERALYRKLGVTNRREAVAQARALDLL